MIKHYEKWNKIKDIVKYCKCGCGNKIIIKPRHKYHGIPDYIHGHNGHGAYDKKLAERWEEIKDTIKDCKCGCGQLIKIRHYHLYNGIPDYIHGHNKRGKPAWHKGKTKEDFPQIAHSEEFKQQMSEMHKGMNQTEETKAKLRTYTGEKASGWKGGISFEPYSKEFNKQLKELIRIRDNHKCQLCGMPQEENIKKLSIHHIDYDKKNSLPFNLISLCKSCHAKTGEDRLNWQNILVNKVEKIMKVKRNLILIEKFNVKDRL